MSLRKGPFCIYRRFLLRAEVTGELVRVSVCHCDECQRRTGSVFAVIPPRLPQLLADRVMELANDYKKLNAMADRCCASARRFADERLSPQRRHFYATVSAGGLPASAAESYSATDV